MTWNDGLWTDAEADDWVNEDIARRADIVAAREANLRGTEAARAGRSRAASDAGRGTRARRRLRWWRRNRWIVALAAFDAALAIAMWVWLELTVH